MLTDAGYPKCKTQDQLIIPQSPIGQRHHVRHYFMFAFGGHQYRWCFIQCPGKYWKTYYFVMIIEETQFQTKSLFELYIITMIEPVSHSQCRTSIAYSHLCPLGDGQRLKETPFSLARRFNGHGILFITEENLTLIVYMSALGRSKMDTNAMVLIIILTDSCIERDVLIVTENCRITRRRTAKHTKCYLF